MQGITGAGQGTFGAGTIGAVAGRKTVKARKATFGGILRNMWA